MHRSVCGVLIIMLSACGGGLKKKGGSSGAAGGEDAALLNGQWIVNCEYNNRDQQYHIINLSINAPKVTETDHQYLDASCNQGSAVITKRSEISPLFVNENLSNAYSYTLNKHSVVASYMLSSSIHRFNQQKTCGKSDWKLHEEVNINAACGVPTSGIKGITRKEGDRLYFGTKNVMGDPSAQTAEERFVRTWVFQKDDL